MFFLLTFRLIVPLIGLMLPLLLETARTGKPIAEHLHFDATLVYLASPFLVLVALSWLVKSRWILKRRAARTDRHPLLLMVRGEQVGVVDRGVGYPGNATL